MVLKWLEARLEAAGVGDWPGLSRLVLAELILPLVVAPILMFGVVPHSQGADRALVGIATLAVLINAAAAVARKLRTAERLHRAEAGVTHALRAVDRASRATTAVLGVLKDQVAPALDKAFAAAEAMTKDRRLSPSVRGRAAKIGREGGAALAILRDIVEPPPAKAGVGEPDVRTTALSPSVVAALPGVRLALAAPQAVEADGGPSASPAPVECPAEPAFRPVRPLRVLAAEHDGACQLLLRTLMAEVGIEPEIVAEGAEALAAWRREPWDLILLDMQMPDVDGLALARSFRAVEARAGWSYTPILALTEKPTSRQRAQFAAAGVDGHLAKPIAASELFAAIAETIAAPAPMGLELARVA